MPRVIGHRSIDPWEKVVLDALVAQLPQDWVVMPSVKWTLAKGGYPRDGEADFVILVPGLGLVVLEVKGSREFMVGPDGLWRRRERDGSWTELKESPPSQATRNMFDLTKSAMEANKWREFPGRFAYLVVYPQGEAKALPPMFDESTVAMQRHMNQLASRIRHALEARGGERRGEEFTGIVAEAIIDKLANRFHHVLKADTSEDVVSDLDKIEQLTRQQFATLRGLFQLPRVAVIGPAGSGKTVLAMWRLKAALEDGVNAIFVCYNRALADSLRLQHPEQAASIWNIDRLFMGLCPGSASLAGQTNFHREVLPGMVMDRSATLSKYDVIVVDEGQDLSEEQLIALLDLLAPEGIWAFFGDWNQDLYGAGKGTPLGAEVVFHLHHNCRNTVSINQASNSYLQSAIESMPGMPEGVRPLIESSNAQATKAWELAAQWGREGSVAILSPYKLENSAMKASAAGHSLKLVTDIKDLGKKGTVFFSTIRSFKGIEAASIIVVDLALPMDGGAFTREDLYVACTRATTRLALLTPAKSVAEHYRSME